VDDVTTQPESVSPTAKPGGFRLSGPEIPGVVPTLAALVCVGLFIGVHSGAGERVARLQSWGWAPASAVWGGSVWALVTSAFLHEELWHIAVNVYWLWVLGPLAEKQLGRFRLLLFVLGAAAFSGAIELEVSDNVGIGLSGVVYALFGYLWVARRHVPEVEKRLRRSTVGLFLVWLVGCWLTTVIAHIPIGNAAHAAGLGLGACVGAAQFAPRWKQTARMVLRTAVVIAALGLVFAPWSRTWTYLKGQSAWSRRDFEAASGWFHKSLDRGQDPTAAWRAIAMSDQRRGDAAAFAADLKALAAFDPGAAEELRAKATNDP
jgi:membrane associated rhomboid family serine protease